MTESRKRSRSAASKLMQEVCMSESLVKVTFDEDNDDIVYEIEWAELLASDEMPLSSAVEPGMKVLAPWRANPKEKISYAAATVCNGEQGTESNGAESKSPKKKKTGRKNGSPHKALQKTPRRRKESRKDPKKLRAEMARKADKELIDTVLKVQSSNTQDDSSTNTSPSPDNTLTTDASKETPASSHASKTVDLKLPSDELSSPEVHVIRSTQRSQDPIVVDADDMDVSGTVLVDDATQYAGVLPQDSRLHSSQLSITDWNFPGPPYRRSHSLPIPVPNHQNMPPPMHYLPRHDPDEAWSASSRTPSILMFEKVISPMKKQLDDVQLMMSLLLQQSGISVPATADRSWLHNVQVSPKEEKKKEEDADRGGDGVFLGYPQKEKYRVWVPGLTTSELAAVEGRSADYSGLGKSLLQLIFAKELQDPEKFCCTPSEGRALLNQDYLRGIRLHLHRKFLKGTGTKMYSPDEGEKWSGQVKKLNSFIRYKRTVVKKQQV